MSESRRRSTRSAASPHSRPLAVQSSSGSPDHSGRGSDAERFRSRSGQHRRERSGQSPQVALSPEMATSVPSSSDFKPNAQWSDPGAAAALCLLELDARNKSTAAVKSRPAGCVLPQCLYSGDIASFLRFDSPQPNQLYVVGGRNEQQEPLDTVEMFDTWHGQWIVCPRMSAKRAGCAAASLPDGSLMVAGGYDERGIVEGLLQSVEVFNPMENTWDTSFVPLGRARWGHSCALLDGLIYAVGGCSLQPGAPQHEAFMETLRSCETYNPATCTWTPSGSMNVARAGARVVGLGERYLAVVGGCDDVFGRAELLSSIELLDRQVGQWSLLDVKLSSPRTTAAVAPLDDRRILVVGGAPSLSSAEVFQVIKQPDENPDAAVPAPEVFAMPEGRMGCQAVTMELPAPGKPYPLCTRRCVVIVGGENGDEEWDAECRQFSSCLVYDAEGKEWRPQDVLPPIPTTRTAMALCVSHGRIAGYP